VLRSANVPCQTFETWPLATEPYAAAFDLVCGAVSSLMSRAAGVALLSSPHLRFFDGGSPVAPTAVMAAGRFFGERGYLGGVDALERLAAEVEEGAGSARTAAAAPAVRALLAAARELEWLHQPAPVATHLDIVLAFLVNHDAGVASDDPLRERRLRARAAIQGVLILLRNEYRELDERPVGFDAVAALVRRWIDAKTFAPRTGEQGIVLVDAASARFGEFDDVQLAGLVEGEWPEHPPTNIFYSTALLRDLGWPVETDRLDYARASFTDLLGLAVRTVTVSTFTLEDDALVTPSPLLDELERAGLGEVVARRDEVAIFELEALTSEPVHTGGLPALVKEAVEWREQRVDGAAETFHGITAGHAVNAFSLSGLERYQDCPFKFFAQDVLRLAEPPLDEPFLSPRARGRFIHEVFHRFFEAWDARGVSTITVDNIGEARAVFAEIAEPLLARLGESDAALERLRLFGSAVSVGMIDIALDLEASRPAIVTGRWLESSFDGSFSLGRDDGRTVRLRGVADRIDLLEGNRLRVIDYKTGYAPAVSRALQVPIYALCAQERAAQLAGGSWSVYEGAYLAFTGKRPLVQVLGVGDDPEPMLTSARERLFEATSGVAQGAFPPRPHDPLLCRTCAYPAVCRKDYVDH
jgi:RecB family exonuclease